MPDPTAAVELLRNAQAILAEHVPPPEARPEALRITDECVIGALEHRRVKLGVVRRPELWIHPETWARVLTEQRDGEYLIQVGGTAGNGIDSLRGLPIVYGRSDGH